MSIMGEYDGYEDEVEGSVMGGDGYFDVVGRAAPRRPAPRRRAGRREIAIPPKPQWRQQLAPGVIQPDEGMVPLPLQPLSNNGTFAAGVAQITWQGDLQKPYRPERLLVSVVRTGTSAVGRLLGLLWVGTDLQQADIFGFDIEQFGSNTAFGTRLTCKAAQPGVKIRLVITPSSVPTGTDTIFATISFSGRVVH
jgi:hypothetical protein